MQGIAQVNSVYAASPVNRALRVLIVDDNSADVDLLTLAFDAAAMSVDQRVARDGVEAKDVLRTTTRVPDMILLDLNMPRCDGFEVLRHLRATGNTVPVVVLSTSSSLEDRQTALALGARAVLTKPAHFRDLVSLVGDLPPLVGLEAPTTPAPSAAAAAALFSGESECAKLLRAIDWAASPLGPVQGWPQSLKTCVRIVLTSRQPMFVWWGDALVNIYNDAYRAILGGKHPRALGQPAAVVWREIWDQVGPRAATAMRSNEGTYDEALLLIMERYGYQEETYYTFSYSPVPNDRGGTGGIICANTDDTQRIIGERRLALLRELSAQGSSVHSIDEVCQRVAHALGSGLRDLPFACVYRLDASRAVLAGTSGISAGHALAPAELLLDAAAPWAFAPVVRAGRLAVVPLAETIATMTGMAAEDVPMGSWSVAPREVAIVPITAGSGGIAAVLVAGLNPHLRFDASFRGFIELIATQAGAALATALVFAEERRRADALAEIDRAKTIFFSNVSHEFRTPLTLMLGPLADALAGGGPLAGESLTLVHRNAQRLLKLVNALLDFSRIEAGRLRAAFRPLDLAIATADLASAFRSAIERAGLDYRIECQPIAAEILVDSDLWEKIVLNLISNALKFTFAGGITVRQAEHDGMVELTITDTGTGIPAEELPRLFERFHRVQGARSRSHEGSGIGLALVHELVKLHGGSIGVESTVGVGTRFTVRIPTGRAHLPAERIVAAVAGGAQPQVVAAMVEEARQWLPAEAGGQDAVSASAVAAATVPATAPENAERVLIVDDNADMRRYLTSLLGSRWRVATAVDGEEALAKIAADPPDLVLSDVMMPHLDGFGLVRRLRADEDRRALPIILLTARAGEEASVEGLQRGADDYLVKPFAARELLARIQSQLSLAKMRSELGEHERKHSEELARSNAELEQFAGVVAHDLRAPLRTITGYLTLLQHRYQGELDANAERCITQSVDTAERMRGLIAALLDYAQAGRGDRRHAAVDLGEMLRAALENHERTIREAQAEIIVGTLPMVTGDGILLAQLFQNLIGNAIKYRSFAVPQVRIHALPADPAHPGWATIVVADNGIGISAEDCAKIFHPFTRVGPSEVEGHGLGLATSRKIVERHGGRIWVESAVGQGSQFYFTVPLSGTGAGTKTPIPAREKT